VASPSVEEQAGGGGDMTLAGIAIIQTAFPGDVILTGGLVRSVRERWPELPLVIVVRPDCRDLASMMDRDLMVITYDKRGSEKGTAGLRHVAGQLAEGPWDTALIPHRSLRSALLARLARFKSRVGFNIGIQQFLHTEAVTYRRGIHEVERNFDLLSSLTGKVIHTMDDEIHPSTAALQAPLFHITDEDLGETESVAASPPFAALAPGSVWPTKRWPALHWITLAQWLAEAGLSIVWTGGPDERDLCQQLASTTDVGVVAAGELSWKGTAALLKQAHVLVANDSAQVHLAGAVGCPAVALFGPTVPAFGFGPFGKGCRSIGIKLGCRPCRLHGSRHCPEGHFRCMRNLKPATVLRSVVDTVRETSEV